MPFVNIKIYSGHPPDRKKRIADRISQVISEEAKIPKEYVWVVIDEVEPKHWFVGGKGGDESK
jgi:4-oxalocrotonate tautomerase family enzyme